MHERLKTDHISEILTQNWQQFEQYVETTGISQTLEFPDELTNVFIPRRILELAQDPHNVRTLPVHFSPNTESLSTLDLYIIERNTAPVSVPEVFRQFQDGTLDSSWKKASRSFYLDTHAPEGLDFRHATNGNLVTSGLIDEYDKILIEYHASVPKGNPDVVYTAQYIDRPDMHGKGVGKSFFDQLDKIWKQLDFSYHTAVIWSPNPDFFLKRGKDIRAVEPELKSRLLPLYRSYVEHGDPVVVTEL